MQGALTLHYGDLQERGKLHTVDFPVCLDNFHILLGISVSVVATRQLSAPGAVDLFGNVRVSSCVRSHLDTPFRK